MPFEVEVFILVEVNDTEPVDVGASRVFFKDSADDILSAIQDVSKLAIVVEGCDVSIQYCSLLDLQDAGLIAGLLEVGFGQVHLCMS